MLRASRAEQRILRKELLEVTVHFDITRLLVVTEGTSELRVQVTGHLLLRRGFPFGLATTHCTQTVEDLSTDGEQESVQTMMAKVDRVQRNNWSNKRASRRVCDSRLTLACLRLDEKCNIKTREHD